MYHMYMYMYLCINHIINRYIVSFPCGLNLIMLSSLNCIQMILCKYTHKKGAVHSRKSVKVILINFIQVI